MHDSLYRLGYLCQWDTSALYRSSLSNIKLFYKWYIMSVLYDTDEVLVYVMVLFFDIFVF